MKRKYSKAMGRRVSLLTQTLFEDSVRKVFKLRSNGSVMDYMDTIHDLRSLPLLKDMFAGDAYADLRKQKEEVDSLYLSKMLKLEDAQLQEILICHECDHIKRAARTLQAITNELSERSIFNKRVRSSSRYSYYNISKILKKSETIYNQMPLTI
jgi:hypothetical protein